MYNTMQKSSVSLFSYAPGSGRSNVIIIIILLFSLSFKSRDLYILGYKNNNDTYIAQIHKCSKCANACQRQTEMLSVCS